MEKMKLQEGREQHKVPTRNYLQIDQKQMTHIHFKKIIIITHILIEVYTVFSADCIIFDEASSYKNLYRNDI